MFLNAKRMAFLGLLLACAVLMVILSGILEFNTLFLLAAAAFTVGIAIRECGSRIGLGYYIASIILSLILAPNKIYCITYAALSFYILVIEFAWERIGRVNTKINRNIFFWMIKFIIFNLIYLPLLIFMPKLIYQGDIHTTILIILLIGGQAALIIYDFAYNYFQRVIWGKLRRFFRF